jgi:RNA polymerase sigma factor (sigma-70 family)
MRIAAERSLDLGDAREARLLIKDAMMGLDAPWSQEWERINSISMWPDTWLVAAIRRDPPDTEALDELAHRHWKSLFGRCQMMALNREEAKDLAQEAWCRLLRARSNLKPEKNFPAYLHTIAKNVWRDRCRSERRAGPMADNRMASLDTELADDDDPTVVVSDAVPDLASIASEAQALLKADVDHALEQLDPVLREVLVARFLTGESCAEIGRRHGRTEQTISGWVRQAVREMQSYFEGRAAGTTTQHTT